MSLIAWVTLAKGLVSISESTIAIPTITIIIMTSKINAFLVSIFIVAIMLSVEILVSMTPRTTLVSVSPLSVMVFTFSVMGIVISI